MLRGDGKEAELQLTRAMRARPTCTFVLPYLAVRVRLQLALAYFGMGGLQDGESPAERDRRRPAQTPAAGSPGRRGEPAARPPNRSHRGRRTGLSPLTPAELRLLPYLQTHLTIREIGERLFVSRNTVSSEVGSIYRKLGVSSRGEAVREATAVGLLGG